MENDRIPKKVYVETCAGSRSVGRARKRGWIRERLFKKEEVWMSGKQGEWCGER